MLSETSQVECLVVMVATVSVHQRFVHHVGIVLLSADNLAMELQCLQYIIFHGNGIHFLAQFQHQHDKHAKNIIASSQHTLNAALYVLVDCSCGLWSFGELCSMTGKMILYRLSTSERI